MRLRLLVVAIVLLAAARVEAQTVVGPMSEYAWSIAAATPAAAQAFTYRVYDDGATTARLVPAAGLVCVAGTGGLQDCSAPLLAYTAGNHSVTLTAKNVVGEG